MLIHALLPALQGPAMVQAAAGATDGLVVICTAYGYKLIAAGDLPPADGGGAPKPVKAYDCPICQSAGAAGAMVPPAVAAIDAPLVDASTRFATFHDARVRSLAPQRPSARAPPLDV